MTPGSFGISCRSAVSSFSSPRHLLCLLYLISFKRRYVLLLMLNSKHQPKGNAACSCAYKASSPAIDHVSIIISRVRKRNSRVEEQQKQLYHSSGDYKTRFCSQTHMHSGIICLIIARLQWRARWEAFYHEMDWLL